MSDEPKNIGGTPKLWKTIVAGGLTGGIADLSVHPGKVTRRERVYAKSILNGQERGQKQTNSSWNN